MKHNVMLTITSLLSILFMTFHLSDDILRGMASVGVINPVAVLILVVWLYGTLVLAERDRDTSSSSSGRSLGGSSPSST
jgi:hypothetical protein